MVIRVGKFQTIIRLNMRSFEQYRRTDEKGTKSDNNETFVEKRKVGADQGKLTCLSMSDGQVTCKCEHKHDLTSIIKELERKKYGSKGFKRKQEHRKNYINWSINQISLRGVKQVNLEKIFNIKYKRSTSKELSHWTNVIIDQKVKRYCEEHKVYVNLQDSCYRSQRCSQCGLVRKLNRKGKVYSCSCGYMEDADYNASRNHAVDLPDIPFDIRQKKVNRAGFFWLETGLFTLDGKAITVPSTTK